ncbi:aryl-sulfate sulfotransferase [Flavobacteriales bacterium]|nr:aryl-sulfate sulfotransferase [Flavobacteriales bacterium]
MKKLLLILLCLPLMTLAQQTVGVFSNQPSSYNGYTLFNSSGSNTTYLIDNCGYKVYEWESNFNPGLSVYLLDNGNLLRTNRLNNAILPLGGKGGRLEILDSSSTVIWSYVLNTDSTLQHHDVEVLPNGNILILAIELIRAPEADFLGSTVSTNRYSEMIIEVNPSTSQIVWEWHAWDHLIQDTDPNLPNYGLISQHPNRLNINYNKNNLPNNPDWIHANSLDYSPELDQIIINCASWDEFWIIDHSTTTSEAADSVGGYSGKGGDILYRWGNPQTYNRGSSTDQVFEFQHDAHWIKDGLPDEGKIMVFNNGQQRGYSSIDIIVPPLDTNNFNNYFISNSNPYGPSNLYWTYSDSINFYSPKISGAQQLENGNTLICSGSQGRLFEIEYQTDSVVWEYIIPVASSGPIIQGTAAGSNKIFRAHRFSPSYTGFNNLTLTPSTVIELNPLPLNCQIYINGCTDSLACNYDSTANINDSTCVYLLLSQQSFSICNGDSIIVSNSVYNSTGNYTDTLVALNGCDSIIYTNVTVDYNTYSYDTLAVTASIVWNNLTINNSGDYSVTLINSLGCDSIAALSITVTTTGILDIVNNKSNLVKITDMLGQETPYRRNRPLFYIYNDGTVEKRIVIE